MRQECFEGSGLSQELELNVFKKMKLIITFYLKEMKHAAASYRKKWDHSNAMWKDKMIMRVNAVLVKFFLRYRKIYISTRYSHGHQFFLKTVFVAL